MAETIVSSLLIGTVLAATVQIVGPIVRSGTVLADGLVAANLANELVEEIAVHRFLDPDGAIEDAIGIDAAEVGGQRSTFDDIDDYNGWSSSPPKLSNNQSNIYLGGWTRTVEVRHVQIDDPDAVSPAYTGLKRVTVRVSKNGVQLAEIVSLQSHAADQLGFVVQE